MMDGSNFVSKKFYLKVNKQSHLLLLFCKVGKHPTEVDNIHNILATAAVRFNSNQLDHLFVLIQQVKIN